MSELEEHDKDLAEAVAPADRQREVEQSVMAKLFGEEAPVPRTYGRYEVTATLGRGGMGEVYLAKDPDLDREVALKVLRADRGSAYRAHLLDEAKTMARLAHPNVVTVFDIGTDGDEVFVAMERVIGGTLREWQQGERRHWREILEVYRQAALGLYAAHREGVIHRDFKPDNVLLSDAGEVKVSDFGLARIDEALQERIAMSLGPQPDMELDEETLSRLSGTPAYMAPETILRRPANDRADQFGFCVALYEALYGERPFAAGNIVALFAAITRGDRQPVPDIGIPSRVQALVDRGLQHEQSARFPSMARLVAELDRCLVPPWKRLVAPGLVLAVAGSVAVGASLPEDQPAPEAPCQGGPALIEPMWNEARAQEVDTALTKSELAYAAKVSAETRQRLDAYAEGWVRNHTEACEATRVRQEQSEAVLDLRMRCLEQRRRVLGATVDRLRAADPAAVRDAVQIASRLPATDRCARIDLLEVEFPPPEDPSTQREIEEFWAETVELEAKLLGPQRDEVLPRVERLQARMDELGDLPNRIKVRLLRARVLQHLERAPEAIEVTLEAYRLATRAGHFEHMSAAARGLTILTGFDAGQKEAGLTWALNAEALAQRVDPEGPTHADALGKAGIVGIYTKDKAAAIERFEHALRIHQSQPVVDPLEVANAKLSLGRAHVTAGHPEEGIELIEEGLAVVEQTLSSDHPTVARGLNALALAQQKAGDFAGSAESFRRVTEAKEREHGPNSGHVAGSLRGWGIALWEGGHPEQALPHFERALAIRERLDGPESPGLWTEVFNLAEALRAMEEHDRALPHYERAVELSKTLDAMAPIVALDGLALAYRNTDNTASALVATRRALELAQRRWGETSLGVARRRLDTAELLWALGERQEALQAATRAKAAAHVAGPAKEEESSFAPGAIETPAQVEARATKWLAEHDVNRPR